MLVSEYYEFLKEKFGSKGIINDTDYRFFKRNDRLIISYKSIMYYINLNMNNTLEWYKNNNHQRLKEFMDIVNRTIKIKEFLNNEI